MNNRIILASSSPRRQQLLKESGVTFETIVSGVDEQRLNGESPQQMAERLAVFKAQEISCRHPDAWVIGADTDVCIDGDNLGKPSDKDAAIVMLRRIQGREHSVWGAYAVLHASSNTKIVKSHETRVRICAMSDEVIQRYVNSGEPMDKAGAYAAQEGGAQFIEAINGSYTNVVGLNICALIADLRRLGILQ